MKEFLYGVPDKGIDPNPEHANQLVNAIFAEDFLALLLQNLHHYDFEVSSPMHFRPISVVST
jgi:hypothetical protein